MILSMLVLLPLACAMIGWMPKPAQQGWQENHGPVVPHGKFPGGDCSLCHVGKGWHKIKEDFVFDHGMETGVALSGAHNTAECLRCHNDRGPVAQYARRGCGGCHLDVHQRQQGIACQDCHSENTWQPKDQVRKHNMTRFPLIGSHAGVACFRCHPGSQAGNFQRADVECESCHQSDLQTTAAAATLSSTPDHMVLGWTRDCRRCHQPTAWKGNAIVHSFFPLTGEHAAADCTQCHINGVFQGTPTTCVGCHQNDYNGTNSPNHAAAGFSTDCMQCHNTSTWQGATFNHNTFSLVGAHISVNCSECHINGLYQGTGRNCVDCHQDDFNGTTNPNHVTSNFSNDCTICHNTNTWMGATFDHNNFPLTGQHIGVNCTQCHINGVYQGTGRNCEDCHQDNYNATNSPNHAASGFSTDCATCHNTNGWGGAMFNHNTFPLTGLHTGLNCTECHINGVFQGTPRTCVGCHQADYNGTTNPNHAASSFSTDCTICHNTNGWAGANFLHNTYPLIGAHTTVNCNQCHINNVYQGTPRTCVGCHQDDYNGTNDPDHAASGFSTNCTECHNNNTWQGAVFNHTFPIQGPHNLACNVCHTNPNNFQQFNCLSCHEHNKTKMDDKHSGENGYVYASQNCVNCHPNGKH